MASATGHTHPEHFPTKLPATCIEGGTVGLSGSGGRGSFHRMHRHHLIINIKKARIIEFMRIRAHLFSSTSAA